MMKKILLAIFLLPVLAGGSYGISSRDTPDSFSAELLFFWGSGCSYCDEAKPFLEELQRKYPGLTIRRIDIMESRENLDLWVETSTKYAVRPEGVPAFFVGEKNYSGFTPEIARAIEGEISSLTSSVPSSPDLSATSLLPGGIDSATTSLPLFTVVIAGLDSFNPCAFFVLISLLGLLVHAGSRRRMLLVGGVFVSFSGILYFIFMAAWLNLFLVAGNLPVITLVAGGVAVLIGGINIKDFFFFKKGVSLSIPESAKPKLFARMRGLLRVESLLSVLTGTVLLALAANSYELLCTAGFPMVYTRVLTMKALPPVLYYLYLALYNLIYVIPLALIVVIFSVTLSNRKLTLEAGRMLKLLSGAMMLLLGATLLFRPVLMNEPFWALGLLLFAILTTIVVACLQRRRKGADLS